ncbi:hypothetical protein BDV41DRAFT_74756 [Aspergillus transmontanensis]|uniref:Uncharacterized protein n=1 Tax=Aspergillus transmontanensis TaxID=1034304 RepID=A0A5N6W8W4_9EURO|nr:hypothetical protein BDV41DRAFT_74756 [Aspergillus transmontanensis]
MICLSRCFFHFYFSLLPLPPSSSSDSVRSTYSLSILSCPSPTFHPFLPPNLALTIFFLPPRLYFLKRTIFIWNRSWAQFIYLILSYVPRKIERTGDPKVHV